MTLIQSVRVPAYTSQDVFWSAFPSASSTYRLFPSVSAASLGDLTRSIRQQIKTSYIFSKCHFTSISPDIFTKEVFHVVTCACVLLVVQRVGVETEPKGAIFFCLDPPV